MIQTPQPNLSAPPEKPPSTTHTGPGHHNLLPDPRPKDLCVFHGEFTSACGIVASSVCRAQSLCRSILPWSPSVTQPVSMSSHQCSDCQQVHEELLLSKCVSVFNFQILSEPSAASSCTDKVLGGPSGAKGPLMHTACEDPDLQWAQEGPLNMLCM